MHQFLQQGLRFILTAATLGDILHHTDNPDNCPVLNQRIKIDPIGLPHAILLPVGFERDAFARCDDLEFGCNQNLLIGTWYQVIIRAPDIAGRQKAGHRSVNP